MHLDLLNKANELLKAINALKHVITGVESLIGLTREQRDEIKAHLQGHHDKAQKALDEL